VSRARYVGRDSGARGVSSLVVVPPGSEPVAETEVDVALIRTQLSAARISNAPELTSPRADGVRSENERVGQQGPAASGVSAIRPGRSGLPVLLYSFSPVPAATVFATFAVYDVFSIVWGWQGRRPAYADSVFVPSPGWPPFTLPPALWVAFVVVGALVVVELLRGGPSSPLRTRPGTMAYLFAADAASIVLYSLAFLDGVTWTAPAMWAAVVMAIASATASVFFVRLVVQGLRGRSGRTERGPR